MKKAAVIGLGDIARFILERSRRTMKLSSVQCVISIPLPKSARPQGIPFYTDYKEMIQKEKPDCVHICLPHYLHYPVAKEAAEMGVNVFCEKPVALNQAQAAEYVAA